MQHFVDLVREDLVLILGVASLFVLVCVAVVVIGGLLVGASRAADAPADPAEREEYIRQRTEELKRRIAEFNGR